MTPTLVNELKREMTELDRRRGAIKLLLEVYDTKPKKRLDKEILVQKELEQNASAKIKGAKKRKPLTEEEVNTIKRMADKGKSVGNIAKHLNRNYSVVATKLKHLQAEALQRAEVKAA